jgi:hypothetical protein
MTCSITNDVKIYRGDPEPISIGSYDVTKGLKAGKELGAAMAEGPGIYFTTNLHDARSYGKNITEFVVGKCSNIITDKSKKIGNNVINNIINSIDKETLEIALSSWNENPTTARKMLLEEISRTDNPQEQLINIWATVFYHQHPEKFIEVMIKNGIDGIKIKKEGHDHFIIYNKKILKPVNQTINCSKEDKICHRLNELMGAKI